MITLQQEAGQKHSQGYGSISRMDNNTAAAARWKCGCVKEGGGVGG